MMSGNIIEDEVERFYQQEYQEVTSEGFSYRWPLKTKTVDYNQID